MKTLEIIGIAGLLLIVVVIIILLRNDIAGAIKTVSEYCPYSYEEMCR